MTTGVEVGSAANCCLTLASTVSPMSGVATTSAAGAPEQPEAATNPPIPTITARMLAGCILSTDPLFSKKVHNIAGLYVGPPDEALVLCVDEKSWDQALDRTAPLLTLRPGQVKRGNPDCSSHGTADFFALLEMAIARVIIPCQRRHRKVEFRNFLDQIDASAPFHLDVRMILDNSATHKTALIHRWLAKYPRYHLHSTPTSSFCLNLVERWFSTLTEKQLRRGVHRSIQGHEGAILSTLTQDSNNAEPKPFVRTNLAQV